MSSTTIRVSGRTYETICDLAKTLNIPLQVVVEQAVELYRRQQLLDATNAAYSALQADAAAWQELEAERAAWDVTLDDGLKNVSWKG